MQGLYNDTSIERMYALYQSVSYILDRNVGGDFVECGVWRGGSLMMIAYSLMKRGDTRRKLYAYDTFRGMTQPTKEDRNFFSVFAASSQWKKAQRSTHNEWCYANISEVKNNIMSTGYPSSELVFVEGDVETTIPNNIPSKIALLRLDSRCEISA